MNHKKHYIGLTDTQIVTSRSKHGINTITPPEKESVWKLFLQKFDDPIIKILLIAALLSLGIGFIHNDFAETIGIFAAVFLATGVAFWFEYDANKKFNILNLVKDIVPIKVYRNNVITEIPKKDIVVGDFVILDAGDEVPADGYLHDSVALLIDESSLTGEPSIDKHHELKHNEEEATYPSNMLLRGTKVLEGHAIYEVSKVGDATEYGKVAIKSAENSGEETPLNKQLDGLAKFIGVIGFIIAALTFIGLFVKDIVLGNLSFTNPQLFTVLSVIAVVVILLSRVWVPIIYDGLAIIVKPKIEIPKIVKKSWLFWLAFSSIIFIALMGILFLMGASPLQSSSWIDIDSASAILQYFMIAVTLIVVTVPEGLPMSVTLSLALSMRRMLKSNNLVRKMHATETMGAATVICTDKTGTLTENQMQVYETYFFSSSFGEISDNTNDIIIKECISANSTAHLDFSVPEKIKTLGNPTESALLLWLKEQNVNYLKVRENCEVIEQISFSTENKYMASVIYSPKLKKKILYVKGAPEIVLDRSVNVFDKEVQPKSEKYINTISEKLLYYQSKAMRTLGFAYEIIDDDKPRILNGKLVNDSLTYFGIVAISDPIREEVPKAVQTCINAGIQIKMITGDTAGTAQEIGRQIGIIGIESTANAIISGHEFEKLTDLEISAQLDEIKILCRAKPTDKQRFVQLLQKNGHVVAVTGDGTNDAPALNYAHVGLSMGSGTSIAKEASDITIIDDSFKSIVTAVLWGRSLYSNIQKFILFQLTINITAMIIVLVGSILGHELPLTVIQMLWVNLIMDTFAAGALASLPPDSKVMQDKPRKNDKFIISKKMSNNILFVGLGFTFVLFYLWYYLQDIRGDISTYNLTIFFTTFVMLQFWNMFNVKAFDSNKSAFNNLGKSLGFITVLFVILIGQVLIVQYGGEVFRTVPLSIKDWLIIIGSTSIILWVGELRRLFFK